MATMAAGQALACAVAWRPPPYAEALRAQQARRAEAERIELVRVVEARLPDGRRKLMLDTVIDFEGYAGGGLTPLSLWSSCRGDPEPGTMMLVYYNRHQVRDIARTPHPRERDVMWVELQPTAVVPVADNVDPEIGPLLRAAAARARERADRSRNRAR
ncbi:MAG: hypothetical protein EON86_10995 [Brevundimonas sp.]|nr:MAG: hypothetical protein EON86_10995 [Brevundimonas sp.]